MYDILEGNLARSVDPDYPDETVLDWLLKARSGNQEALLRLNHFVETLFEEYAARRGVQPGDIERLADDAVSRLPRAIQRFDPARANVRRWAIGLSQKVVGSYFRRLPKFVSIDDHAEDLGDDERESPNQAYERRRSEDEVCAATGTLPRCRKEILRLRYYEELDYEEIARRLKIEPGTARVEMCLALRDLADRLGFPKPRRPRKIGGKLAKGAISG